MSQLNTIVVDCGSFITKAGFSEDEQPTLLTPSATFKDETQAIDIGKSMIDESCPPKYFVDQNDGHMKDFDSLNIFYEKLFYNKLHIEPNEHAVLLSEAPFIPKSQRERILQIMNFKFIFNGLSVSCGHSRTYSAPVYEGHALPHAIKYLNIAGHDMTEYLIALISKRSNGGTIQQPQQQPNEWLSSNLVARDVIQKMKEQECYMLSTPNQYERALKGNSIDVNSVSENSTTNETLYELPDGHVFSLTREERFQIPEILYQPQLVNLVMNSSVLEGSSSSGRSCSINTLEEMVIQSTRACGFVDQYFAFQVFNDIVVEGGCTRMKGFALRLRASIVEALLPLDRFVTIHHGNSTQCNVWQGGLILGSLSIFTSIA
ncbi:hypothetical protein C9374_008135 [Naegleria lovaniensis]|uniref:Actin n=1 Tax=Naegleria lovaniensis TaxID=51637 RepID=A0AA88GJT7_NAELO|nr:uncharacterized protein C9374_008135 [Naegleria lovaniensis]KAG2378496.1 hypothetical protein C9374_008135 [Naegleria lovaniensis]